VLSTTVAEETDGDTIIDAADATEEEEEFGMEDEDDFEFDSEDDFEDGYSDEDLAGYDEY
jgi:hypothetical protein